MKTDQLGRVQTPKAKRQEILDEYERSGLSGPKFAATVGIKYQTFATWVAGRKKQRLASRLDKTGKSPGWVEAVIDQAPAYRGGALILELPGGAKMSIVDEAQAVLAACLLRSLQSSSC